jgi:hypothetical protein
VDTNNLSLIEIVETIRFAFVGEGKVGAAPVEIVLVSMWWRTDPEQPETALYRVYVVAPNGDVIGKTEPQTLNLSIAQKLRFRLRFQGVAFTENGRYWLRGYVQPEGSDEWREVARTPLEMMQEDPPDATENTP